MSERSLPLSRVPLPVHSDLNRVFVSCYYVYVYSNDASINNSIKQKHAACLFTEKVQSINSSVLKCDIQIHLHLHWSRSHDSAFPISTDSSPRLPSDRLTCVLLITPVSPLHSLSLSPSTPPGFLLFYQVLWLFLHCSAWLYVLFGFRFFPNLHPVLLFNIIYVFWSRPWACF